MITRRIAIILSLLIVRGFSYTGPVNGVYTSDGSNTDVSAAIAVAVDGDTVTIPANPGSSFSWTGGVSIITAGVKLQGAGSGRIIGRSEDSVTVGTGAKTFTTIGSPSITAGQTLTISRTGGVISGGAPTGALASMTGTVTSYSGTTLVMNITSTVGSGTHPLWIIATQPTTTVTNDAGSADLITITEDATNSVEVSGIRFLRGTGTGFQMLVQYRSGGQPVLIHDNRWTTYSVSDIEIRTNRGVFWNCSWDARTFSSAPLAIQLKPQALTTSWNSISTMGTADSTGANNIYVEDCDFHAYLNCADNDDNARSAWRHCLFNNAGFATHGADTSVYGNRHFEVYDSEFVFEGYGTGQTMNLTWWFFLRGGTAVIADNIMPDINSSDYANKSEINMTEMALQRNTGTASACWGFNVAGIQYPAPRQVGFGYVTGLAGTVADAYGGDTEPLYIWGNSSAPGVPWNPGIGISDYGWQGAGSSCGTDAADLAAKADDSSSYIVAGRDYFNNGTSKPGYTKYTYPHPLRGGAPPASSAGARKIGRGNTSGASTLSR